MKVLFFGSLGDRIGREVEVDPPAEIRTVADLRRFLAGLHPEAGAALTNASVRACIGDAIVDDDHDVSGAEEVQFFPPLSGG